MMYYIEDASRFTAGPHSCAMVIRIRGRSIAEFVFDGFGKLVFLLACCVAKVLKNFIFSLWFFWWCVAWQRYQKNKYRNHDVYFSGAAWIVTAARKAKSVPKS